MEKIFKQTENYLTKSTVLVFEDEQAKKSFIKQYQDKYIFSKNKYFTKKEFIKNGLVTEKVILAGIKRTFVFYASLSEAVKEFFDVKDFVDAFVFAKKFFRFFENLNEADVDTIDRKFFFNTSESSNHLQWQLDQYGYLMKAKECYHGFLAETEYNDEIFLKELDFDRICLDFEQVLLIGIENISKRENNIFNQLRKIIKVIDVNFCTDNHCFLKNNIRKLESIRCSDEFSQIMDFSNKCNRTEFDVAIDLADNAGKYSEIIDSERVDVKYLTPLTSSKIFSVLKGLEVLCDKLDSYKLEGFIAVNVLSNVHFRRYYKISEETLQKLRKELTNNKVYIEVKKYFPETLIKDLEMLKRVVRIEEFNEFIYGFELDKFLDKFLDKVLDIFFGQLFGLKKSLDIKDNGALSLMKASDWLKVLLLSCEDLEVEYVCDTGKDNKLKLLNWNQAWYLENKRIVLLNANENSLSFVRRDKFLFTEKQKQKLGIPTCEELLAEKRHKFLNLCLSNQKLRIYSIEDSNGENQTSSFLEEILLNINQNIISEEKICSEFFLNSYFSNFTNNCNYRPVSEELVSLTYEDFGASINLSATSFSMLKACPLRYFLDKVINLERNSVKEANDIQPVILGIIVHEIFAEVCSLIKNNLGIKISFKEALRKINDNEIIRDVFKRYQDYLPIVYHQEYAKEVLFPFISDSISYFFEEICGSKVKLEDIKNIYIEDEEKKSTGNPCITELNIFEKEVKININGRADLRIELNDGRAFIFDFKTGSSLNKTQLSFYKYFYYGNWQKEIDVVPELIFYKVFEKKQEIVRAVDLKEKIAEVFERLIAKEEYDFGLTTLSCNYCEHEGICRKNG